MKISSVFSILAAMVLTLTACKQETAASPNGKDVASTTKAPAVKPETASLQIDGMTCAIGCAKTIEEKLVEMPGVQEAKVDFETKKAVVNFDADQLSGSELKAAIESCADGKTYKVTDMKVAKKS